MNCPIETDESAELLLDYCARKLDADTEATLRKHIGVCPACQHFAAAQKTVWDALDTWEAAPISADFNRRLYHRIEREATVSIWERLWRPFRPALVRQGLPIAAAASLLVMAGILLERPSQTVPQDQNQAQVETVQPDQLDSTLQDIEMLREFSHIVRNDARPNAM